MRSFVELASIWRLFHGTRNLVVTHRALQARAVWRGAVEQGEGEGFTTCFCMRNINNDVICICDAAGCSTELAVFIFAFVARSFRIMLPHLRATGTMTELNLRYIAAAAPHAAP